MSLRSFGEAPLLEAQHDLEAQSVHVVLLGLSRPGDPKQVRAHLVVHLVEVLA
jgi:hypothetical protein